MTIVDFSEYQYCKTLDANEVVPMGSFTMVESGLLSAARPLIFIKNYPELAANTNLTIKFYNDKYLTSLYCTSAVLDLSTVTFSSGGTCFLGYVELNLPGNTTQLNDILYPTIEIGDYARRGDDFYIGLIYDYPIEIYQNSGSDFLHSPLCMQLFIKQNPELR